jgi:poly(A) polymerase
MNNRELARQIVDVLSRKGHSAYWAGGCVRDMLLGEDPKDFDVATDAVPGQLLEYFPDALQVGAQFGVILVRRADAQVEVATFRTDHEYRDGRHPESVSFARSAEQDVQRRDFTINGLLFDPAEEKYLDFVGGR